MRQDRHRTGIPRHPSRFSGYLRQCSCTVCRISHDDGEPEIKDEEDGEGDQRAGARFAVDGKIFDIHEHTFPVETK